eukprot:scpid97788/ scgid21130/ 
MAVVRPPLDHQRMMVLLGQSCRQVTQKKAALQRATEDAFSRIVLVVLPSGKVAIEQIRDDPPGCAVVSNDITSSVIEVNCLPDCDDSDGDEEKDGDCQDSQAKAAGRGDDNTEGDTNTCT